MIATSLLLLVSGSALNLYAQYLADARFAAPEAHILPTVKFLASLIFAGFARLSRPPALPPPSPRQRRLMALIGVLDAAAYVSYCVGFIACGAVLSNLLLAAAGQTFTALATRFVLRKRLTGGQLAAIACVGLGLAIRALPATVFDPSAPVKPSIFSADSSLQFGVAAILLAALLYSCLGVAYESLVLAAGGPPPYSQVLWNISLVGALGAASYQALYVAPRADALVLRPLAASGLSVPQLAAKLAVLGMVFNLHMFVQSRVFKSEGALGVSLVNAVRGAVLAVVAGLFLCSPAKPAMCMTVQTALSAAMTTAGGVAWVLADAQAKKKRRGSGKGQEKDAAAEEVDKKEL